MPKKRPSPNSTLEDYPDHVRAIGMISIEIVNLEGFLGELLAALLHIHSHFGRIVYLTPKSAFGRLDILETVYQDTAAGKQTRYDDIESVLSRARAAIGKRHELIHNAWGIESGSTPVTVTRQSVPLKRASPPKPVPIEELNQLIENIRDLIRDVSDLAIELSMDWPPYTWQPKQPSQSSGDPNQKSDSPQKEKAPKPKTPP